MTKYKTKNSIIGKIVFAVVLILAITLLSVFVFGNLGKHPASTDKFSVTVNGNTYDSDSDNEKQLTLRSSGQVKFDVEGTDSYTVKVISNLYDKNSSANDYSYYVDGQSVVFRTDDYTNEFIKQNNKYDNYFIIECTPGCYDLKTLLQRKYNTDNIEFNKEITETYPYRLQITSSEGKVIEIQLSQVKATVLATPKLSVEIQSAEADKVNVQFRFSDIDERADGICLYAFWTGTEVYQGGKKFGVNVSDYTESLLLAGSWEFYIEVTDSTGTCLSGVSERVQINVTFSQDSNNDA